MVSKSENLHPFYQHLQDFSVSDIAMKSFVFFGLLFPSILWGNHISPDVLRKTFHACVLDETKTMEFYLMVSNIQNPDNLEKAYQAAGNAMMANVTANLYTKYTYVRKYISLIDHAVATDPENVEIRFLRLAIDLNIPYIFGRTKNANEDKQAVMSLVLKGVIPDFDRDFQRYILYFLKDEQICSEEEIMLISSRFRQI